jgi:hypothetical protein
VWRFLKLEGNIVSIDAIEYYLSDVGKILGILLTILRTVFKEGWDRNTAQKRKK